MSTPLEAPNVTLASSHKELLKNREALPEALKPPPKDRMQLCFREGYEATAKLLPLDHIPAGLRTFRVGRHLQPPMLRYGWPLTPEDLVNLAERKGFLGAKTKNRDGHPMTRINIYDSEHLLQHIVRDDLGITSITPEIRPIFPKMNGREMFLISLATTWNDSYDVPPREDVDKVAQHLELTEEAPKWYIDFNEPKWAFRTFKTFPVARTFYRYPMLRIKGVNDDGCPWCNAAAQVT